MSVQDLSLTKYVDKATPVLWKFCATGSHIKESVLVVRKAGGTPLEYIKITMQDCLISSYQQGPPAGGEDTVPTDSFSMDFARLDLWYSPDGTERAAVTAGYDLKANKKI